jgi:putative oxidoreductase
MAYQGRMLPRVLARFSEPSYSFLRVVSGAMFAFHGLQKVFGVLAEKQPAVMSQIWIGGVIELVCGLAIALGAFTVWAAFLASGTMAVAYVQFHWKLELGSKLIPAKNNGELALLYSVLFLFIACRGAGALSWDGRRPLARP